MDTKLQNNLQKVLLGQLWYTSNNLAFNMLINRLKLKLKDDPGCITGCMKEVNDFAAKYPRVIAADFSAIENLN